MTVAAAALTSFVHRTLCVDTNIIPSAWVGTARTYSIAVVGEDAIVDGVQYEEIEISWIAEALLNFEHHAT